MNKAQRKAIEVLVEHLHEKLIDLTQLAEDEREKFDNLSEGLQASDKGQLISEAADALESAQSSLEEAIQTLEGIE